MNPASGPRSTNTINFLNVIPYGVANIAKIAVYT
jgi:hypothetical protein